MAQYIILRVKRRRFCAKIQYRWMISSGVSLILNDVLVISMTGLVLNRD
jgi:hypothetical protein